MAQLPRLPRDAYTVGWVCALPVELAAAAAMLDEEHAHLERGMGDHDDNLYSLGSIMGHNVAIVCLPAGRIGNNPAAVVATQMRATFKGIQSWLMVGIGGGVPSAAADIRLGDVVVGQPQGMFGGVVQYDSGKATPSGFERTGALNLPPDMLLAAVAKVRANEMLGRSKLDEHITKLERTSATFQRSMAGPDVLFQASYKHAGGPTCARCSSDRHEAREPRDRDDRVATHYGTIASGNQVIKDAVVRDKLSAELGGVLCFEMEAAGLLSSFACLVVRGVCDYADSHKNKQWQAYAAGTAAAYAKEVLSVLTPAGHTQEPPGNSPLSKYDSLPPHVVRSPAAAKADSHQHNIPEDVVLPRRHAWFVSKTLQWFLPVYVGSFLHYDYAAHFQDIRRQRYPSTCCWTLSSDSIRWLRARKVPSILWMSGCHGLGKSTMITHLVDELLPSRPKLKGKCAVIASFCSDEKKNNTASKVLSTAIHQLLVRHPEVQNAILRYDQTNYFGVNLLQPKRGKNRPAQALWRVLVETVREAKLDMLFLMVDGLDHCTPESQTDLLRLFQSALDDEPCIKILFSSVPSPDIKKHFSYIEARHPEHTEHQNLEDLEDYINTDISILVKGEIARLSKVDDNPLSPTDQDRIEEKLSNESSGAFLPVALLLREIEERGDRSVAEILEDIPRSLQALYQGIFSQIASKLHGRQIPPLKYLLYSVIPLSPRDLSYACYVLESKSATRNRYSLPNDVGPDNLISLRQDLQHFRTILKWRSDKEQVTFIHPTSKQYLIHRTFTEHAEPFLSPPWQAHGHIASACLKLILATSELNLPQPWATAAANEPRYRMIQDWPFLPYALRYWNVHLKEAISQTPQYQEIDGDLMRLIRRFTHVWNLEPEGFRFMLLDYWGIEGLTKHMASNVSIIEVFSGLGLTRCLKTLLESQPNTHRTITPTVRRAVLLAIRGGHEECFDLLVHHFDITSLDGAEYQHIISESAWSKHFSLLVKAMRLRKPRLQELVDAIDIAFTTGERATLHEITKDKAIFEMRDQQGRTCLHHLCISRFSRDDAHPKRLLAEAIYMVANRVEINAKDRFGFTALHYVCLSRSLCVLELVQGLIRHGADVFAATNGGLTPFHLAVYATKEPEVVQLFLRLTSYKIGGVRSRGSNTPLHWAVRRRYMGEDEEYTKGPCYLIVKLLVHAGADPYVPNRRGLTATQSARYKDIESLLISTYENVDQIRSTELVLPRRQADPYKGFMRIDSTEADNEQPEPQEYYAFEADDADSQDTESFHTAQETSQSSQSVSEPRKVLWRFWLQQ